MDKDIYGFKVKTIDGKEITLDAFKGKVLLIVNTASKCLFTDQYKGLQKIYEKYKEKGFEVLGFPCNQFASQEPGDEQSIANFCELNYGVNFPLFSKIEVNGENAHPLYKYLKEAKPGLFDKSIKWNFTKFLIDKKGIPVHRYAPTTAPENICSDIEKLLEQPAQQV